MKWIPLLLMACSLFFSSNSQTSPLEPCCNIILKNTNNNVVVARDQTTGRLYSFQVNATDIKSIVVGDVVNVDQLSSTITSIRGSARNYNIPEPDKAEPASVLASLQVDNPDPVNGMIQMRIHKAEPAGNNMNIYRSKALATDAVNTAVSIKTNSGTPCCTIVDVQPDHGTPCCGIVTFKNNSNGSLSYFTAPVEISNTLKTGQAVYIEPMYTVRINKAEPAGIKNTKINDATPCCSVTSVQPDPGAPCCNIVTYKNNSTGGLFQFRLNKNNSMQIGQPLYSETANGFAIVQSSFGGNGQMNSYGYAATSTGNSNADNESAKWVISDALNMKGVLGRLDMNFSDGVYWNVWIYDSEEKMVNSFYPTHNTKTYNLSPGQYRILLGNVPVENVPIQKGKQTRLKAGYLNIVSEGNWDLYDDEKQKSYTSNTKPQKIALPIGNYQLKLGSQYYPVVIKDGQSVEF